ncbi:Hypothetical predicted protein [Lecanosticta acicola]|uniref:BTB domain-containing protein n=1 Tax=Lecanosticta acicola TaxID=111012 RepID=A0AAI8Z0Z4_9PEZI|nr:Hypothetical predicted protein [Lecanosticta acicola]
MSIPATLQLPAIRAYLQRFQHVFQGLGGAPEADAYVRINEKTLPIHFCVVQAHSEALMTKVMEYSDDGTTAIIAWPLTQPHETLDSITALFTYCYHFDYSGNNNASDLTLHMQVFALAFKYELPHLRGMAGYKFRKSAPEYISSEEFYQVIGASQADEVLVSGPGGEFSELIAEVIADNRQLLSAEEGQRMLTRVVKEFPLLSLKIAAAYHRLD